MKISLITVCYNREETIARTIESVAMQDYYNIEYIIIDGASTDDTVAIINNYHLPVSNFKFISEPDKGMYEAINKGIRMATGDVIGLMHSDDVFYSPDVLSKVAAAFEESQADIVYGNGIYVDPGNPQKIIRNWISGNYNKKKMKHGWLPLHPTIYAKRKIFNQCGLYDESYKIAADSEMLVRMLYENDYKVFYLNEHMVKVQMGGLSTSLGNQLAKWKEDIRLYRAHNFQPYWCVTGKVLSKIKQLFWRGYLASPYESIEYVEKLDKAKARLKYI